MGVVRVLKAFLEKLEPMSVLTAKLVLVSYFETVALLQLQSYHPKVHGCRKRGGGGQGGHRGHQEMVPALAGH